MNAPFNIVIIIINFRPDITVMVDWALKINYLSIGLNEKILYIGILVPLPARLEVVEKS